MFGSVLVIMLVDIEFDSIKYEKKKMYRVHEQDGFPYLKNNSGGTRALDIRECTKVVDGGLYTYDDMLMMYDAASDYYFDDRRDLERKIARLQQEVDQLKVAADVIAEKHYDLNQEHKKLLSEKESP